MNTVRRYSNQSEIISLWDKWINFFFMFYWPLEDLAVIVWGFVKIIEQNWIINCSKPIKSNYWVYLLFSSFTFTSRTRFWIYIFVVKKYILYYFKNFINSTTEIVYFLSLFCSKFWDCLVEYILDVYFKNKYLKTLWYFLNKF
jgi:hypothetical protein